MKRKALSKKTRFDVFKRDYFTCCYCGNAPPNIILEVDHVIPVASGGDNCEANLVTSCFDCNRGKGAVELSVIPESLNLKVEVLKEKENQIKAYRRFIKSIKKRETNDIESVNEIFESYFEGYSLTESFKRINLGNTFLKKLPLHEVQDAMYIACDKIEDRNKCIKYFCGVCWNKIKRGDK